MEKLFGEEMSEEIKILAKNPTMNLKIPLKWNEGGYVGAQGNHDLTRHSGLTGGRGRARVRACRCDRAISARLCSGSREQNLCKGVRCRAPLEGGRLQACHMGRVTMLPEYDTLKF